MFSFGLYVHVLYIKYPPTLFKEGTCESISFCRISHVIKFFTDQCPMLSTSFRNMPSPLQGASTSNKSDLTPELAKFSTEYIVATALPYPHFIRFCFKLPRRVATTSLAISRTSSFSFDNI